MRDVNLVHGVYGVPPAQLAQVPAGARQLSPLSPGSDDLGGGAAMQAKPLSPCGDAP
jgi:16S rRNA (guanine1207-N2)-methyltransferase